MRGSWMCRWLLLGALVWGAAACSDEGGSSSAGGEDVGADVGGEDAGVGDVGGGDDVDEGDATDAPPRPAEVGCDPLVPEVCSLPWPSNLYLKPDATRATGFELDFGPSSLPVSKSGGVVDPTPYRRMDGFALGTPILAWFPELSLEGLAAELDPAPSMSADAAIVLLEVAEDGTARRVPYWVETDQTEPEPAKRLVFVRPLVILKEATRYVVGFRGLERTSGEAFEASEAFAKLRDGAAGDDPALAWRQERFESIFTVLEAEGVPRSELILAWDFVTGSAEARFKEMLHIRQDALARAEADGAPEITITDVEEFVTEDDDSGRPVDDDTAFRVRGTFTVPDYTRPDDKSIDGYEGFVFNYGADGLPRTEATREAKFWMLIPRSALSGEPHQLVQYGHGLMGTGEEVFAGYNQTIANEHHVIFFCANMTGMSTDDLNSVLATLLNIDAFPWMGDRLQQGLLEHILLARAMKERLATLDLIVDNGIAIDAEQVFYSGISQGGIFGGAVVALSPDIRYGHLGVPGQNYNILLNRSVDFDGYAIVLRSSYEATWDQAIALATIQILWEQSEPTAYMRHITRDPLAGQPPSYVLLAPAKGDYQVANLTVEIAARTDMDIALMADYGRSLYGVDETAYPHRGSGVVMYDYGNPWPEPGNVPPSDDLGDPHGKPRREPWHQQQMMHFFRNDAEIIDVCGGDGCTPD